MQHLLSKPKRHQKQPLIEKKLVFYSEYVYFAHFCNVPTWISSHPNKVKQKTNKTSHFSNGEKTWDLQWCSIIFDDLQAYIYIIYYYIYIDYGYIYIYIYIYDRYPLVNKHSYWKWPSRKFVDLRHGHPFAPWSRAGLACVGWWPRWARRSGKAQLWPPEATTGTMV